MTSWTWISLRPRRTARTAAGSASRGTGDSSWTSTTSRTAAWPSSLKGGLTWEGGTYKYLESPDLTHINVKLGAAFYALTWSCTTRWSISLCSVHYFSLMSKYKAKPPTGWPFRLWQTSHWHLNKSSVLVHGPHTKAEHYFEVNWRFVTTWMVTVY